MIRYEGRVGLDSIPYHLVGGLVVLKERFAGRAEFRASLKVTPSSPLSAHDWCAV